MTMLKGFKVRSFLLVTGLGAAAVTGCDDPFAECREGFNCPGDDEGPKSGGSTSTGGKNSGSGSSANSSGGLGGGGAPSSGGVDNVGGMIHTGGNGSGGENLGGACGDTCTEEEPYCLEDEATCVECLKHSHCEDEQSPICSLNNTCERCKSDGDCRDVLGLTDKPVCITDTEHPGYGSCIGCLDADDCGGNICDPATDSCVDLPYRAKGVCAPCEHDLECKVGQYCVPQVFGGETIGSFCTETKESRVGAEGSCEIEGGGGPPFAANKELTSVGGVTAWFCALATTTCPAYSDHRKTKTGCDAATTEANAVCGAPNVDDGLCRKTDGGVTFYCTYRCGSDIDCKPGFTCPTEGDQYCSI